MAQLFNLIHISKSIHNLSIFRDTGYHRWLGILSVGLVFFSSSCRKDDGLDDKSYHILIVAGQSNTHYGEGLNPSFDTPHDNIFQLGRHDGNNMKIIPAVEPLDHYSRIDTCNGFALTFAKLYYDTYMRPDEELLIIPAGKASTSFADNDWNKGDPLFENLIARYNFIKLNYPASKLVAVLWHQGESDVNTSDYEHRLDQFIYDIRTSLRTPNLPFILGGMVPYWTNQSQDRIDLQEIIKNTPNRVPQTGYADPSFPIIIEKENNDYNSIHFSAAGLRELGLRYFTCYPQLHNP